MGQSLVQNYIHIVFSTKHRIHLIDEHIENELYRYLGGTCNNLECQVLIVGGHKNHVHILCMLSKKITVSKLLQELKSQSSRWIKSKGVKYRYFYWQDGYAAFSVNPADVNVVSNYISNQKSQHANRTFKEELRSVLTEYAVEFDERYLWN